MKLTMLTVLVALVSLCVVINAANFATDRATEFHDRINTAATETTVSGVVFEDSLATGKKAMSVSDRIESMVGGFVKKKRGENVVTAASDAAQASAIKKRAEDVLAKRADKKMSSYADKKKSALKARKEMPLGNKAPPKVTPKAQPELNKKTTRKIIAASPEIPTV